MITLYSSELKDIMFAITKWAGYILIVDIVLLILLKIVYKPLYIKLRNVCLLVGIIIVGVWAWYFIPRAMDYEHRSFVAETEATLYLEPTNIDNGNTWRFGTGSIKTSRSSWVTVDGLDFIDFPIENGQPDTFYGTFVYGERSKQLVYYDLKKS